MKKRVFAILMMLPYMAMAEDVLGNSQTATTEAGGLFASGVILVLLSLWIVPIIIGFMVYNSRKKKAEQNHEDMGLATAGMVLAVVIVSYAAVYFFEGGVGMAMGKGVSTYSEGVKQIIGPVLQHGMDLVTGK